MTFESLCAVSTAFSAAARAFLSAVADMSAVTLASSRNSRAVTSFVRRVGATDGELWPDKGRRSGKGWHLGLDVGGILGVESGVAPELESGIGALFRAELSEATETLGVEEVWPTTIVSSLGEFISGYNYLKF